MTGTPHDATAGIVCRTASEAETLALGATLAGLLTAGDVVALEGQLGAGKTLLCRGACDALGFPAEAGFSSPSYALVNHYLSGRVPIAHVDLYRLADGDELEAIGFRDLVDGRRVVFIEWPRRADAVADVATLWVLIEDQGPEQRRLTITVTDASARPELVPALAQQLAPWMCR